MNFIILPLEIAFKMIALMNIEILLIVNTIRKIILFTPPFNLMFQLKLGQRFLNLIKNISRKTNPLIKIYYNTLRLSYCCADYLEKIIKTHNNRDFSKYKNSTKVAVSKFNYNNTNNSMCNAGILIIVHLTMTV